MTAAEAVVIKALTSAEMSSLINISDCNLILSLYENSNITIDHVDYQCFQKYELPSTLILLIILAIIAVGTTLGNTLVVLAVALVKKLQTPSNFLIVSLAASDLLVGCIVLPFAIVKQLHKKWPLTNTMCDVFIVFDVLLCTSSILNLTAISVDRYLVITRPFQYAVKRTPWRMSLMIVIVWLTSALISIPPIVLWKRDVKPGTCDYPTDLGYQIYATLCAFYLPLFIMLVLYGRIFKLAHRMATADAKQKVTTFPTKNEDEPPPIEAKLLQKDHRQIRFDDENELDDKDFDMDDLNEMTAPTTNGQVKKSSDQSSSASDMTRSAVRARPQKEVKRKQKSNSETKAITTLGIIMGGFTLCWLPFFIIQVIIPVLTALDQTEHMPPDPVIEFFVWCGYVNSFLNPIIYAKFNRDFRTPFKQILLCHCRSINSRLRSESYAEQYGLTMHSMKRQNGGGGSGGGGSDRSNRRKSSDLANRKSQQVNSANGTGHVNTS